MNELFDLELLKQYNPEIIKPGYLRLSLKQSILDIAGKPEDFKVFVFSPKQPPDRDWSVELVITRERNNKDVWHSRVMPAREDIWIKGIPAMVAQLIRDLAHSYNKARDKEEQAGEEETLEVHSTTESLDLENWPIETQREVVAGFAVKNGYTHLFGDAGVGKSILAHNIGLHAASGLHYLGFNALLPPIKVLYMSLEMFYDEFRERNNKLAQHFPEVARDNFSFICPEAFDITSPKDRFLLGNTVTKYGIKLVIVDSHTDWRGEVDLNDNGSVGAKIILPVIELMKQLDFSIILLDHTGWQGKRPSGAKVVWNKASIGILMEAAEEENSSKISFRKWRNTARRKPRPISLRYEPETYQITTSTTANLLTICESLNLPDTPGGVDKQIMELTGDRERRARQKKAELIRMGLLYKDKGKIHRGDGGADLSKAEPIDPEDL